MSGENLLHGDGTERADQLVLQVRDTDVEAEGFQIGASEVRTEARLLETAPEVALLSGVTEARQSEVESLLTAEHVQEPPDALRTSDRHHVDALGVKVPTAARSERFDRDAVARPFDEHDRTCGERGHGFVVARDSARYARSRRNCVSALTGVAAQDRLHVDDRSSVQGVQVADEDSHTVNGHHLDAMESDRIRSLG